MAKKHLSVVDGVWENLPSLDNTVPGRILITTDKGEMYYEPEEGKRIKIFENEVAEAITKLNINLIDGGNAKSN